MRRDLLEDARRSTVAFGAAELAQLTGSREDLGTPAYLAVKERLRRLRIVDARVRFVYIFRFRPETGDVIFLADSANPGAKDESLPGDLYREAPKSPGLQEIIRTGRPASEGPLADEFGTWITAYATIGRVSGAADRRGDILGLDVDAAHWKGELWQTALQNAFFVWV